MPDFSLHKNERLSGSKAISSLFDAGISVYSHPVRMIYRLDKKGSPPAKMAVSVPKRLFKRAVDRNLLKRRIREAYRLQKPELYKRLQEKELSLHLVIQYSHREIEDFQTVESGIIKVLEKLTL